MRLLPAIGLALAALHAGAPAQEPEDVFSEVIDVRVVNLESVVTDAAGERVRGLTRDDFRLIVDGREVPIDYFSEVRDGVVLPEKPRAEAAGGIADPADPEALERRSTNFLVFIDDVFSIGAQRDLVLENLGEQLALIHPEDQVAVMSFDGSDVERLSGWTSSAAEIGDALARAARRKAKGAFRRTERAIYNPAYSQQESYIRLVEEQLENLTVAASIAMRSAAPATGRKVLLLLSGGWPYELNIYDDPTLRNTFRNSDSLNQRFMAEREQFGRNLWSYGLAVGIFQALADTANLLGYTIYPIDVPGLGAGGAGISEDRPTPELGVRPSAESSVEASLLFLAAETGGKAMLNRNRLLALERAAADTSSYYWLGFTADRRADNRRHAVRLESRHPGLEVRTRKDYVDFSRQVEVEMMVEGALLFREQAAASDFDVRVGAARRLARKKMEVPIQLEIPLERLTHLYYGGEYLANMTVTLAVKDKRDTLSSVVTVPFQSSQPQRPGTGEIVTYEMDVELWREPHDLVVMVQDVATGTVLSSSVRVQP